MVLAVSAITRGDQARNRLWLVTTAVLGALFLGGQVYEFTTFDREGLGFTTNVFASAFFTLTGFHGVHVTVGILMLLSLVGLSLRGTLGQDKAETVEIVGLYWHFVDIVWILIFTVVYLTSEAPMSTPRPSRPSSTSPSPTSTATRHASDALYVKIFIVLVLITAAEVATYFVDFGDFRSRP